MNNEDGKYDELLELLRKHPNWDLGNVADYIEKNN